MVALVELDEQPGLLAARQRRRGRTRRGRDRHAGGGDVRATAATMSCPSSGRPSAWQRRREPRRSRRRRRRCGILRDHAAGRTRHPHAHACRGHRRARRRGARRNRSRRDLRVLVRRVAGRFADRGVGAAPARRAEPHCFQRHHGHRTVGARERDGRFDGDRLRRVRDGARVPHDHPRGRSHRRDARRPHAGARSDAVRRAVRVRRRDHPRHGDEEAASHRRARRVGRGLRPDRAQRAAVGRAQPTRDVP